LTVLLRGYRLNALPLKNAESMGSQWVMSDASVVYDPLQAL